MKTKNKTIWLAGGVTFVACIIFSDLFGDKWPWYADGIAAAGALWFLYLANPDDQEDN